MNGTQTLVGSKTVSLDSPLLGATAVTHPDDVINDPHLTLSEKRAVLASWASDVRAVANAPTLRQLDNGAIVDVEDILRALRSLDGDGEPTVAPGPRLPDLRRRWPMRRKSTRRRIWRDDDNDDDPPPCPALINRRPSDPLSGGVSVVSEMSLAA